jgi:hypothetical protein
MKYLLTADQKAFFEKHQFIEFEGFVSERDLAFLKGCALSGRDNYRKHEKVKEFLTSSQFADTIKELCSVRQLRLGFDEFRELTQNQTVEGQANLCLSDTICVTPLLAGVMICLEGEEADGKEADEALQENQGPQNPTQTGFQPFPLKKGSALFFSPTLVWSKEAQEEIARKLKTKKQKYLLLGYAGPRPLYVYQEKDLHTHLLKSLGYVFGDRLKESTHPALGR